MFKSLIEKIISKQNAHHQVINEILIPERNQQLAPKFLSAIYEKELPNNYEGHFKNGELINVSPRNRKKSLYEDRKTAYVARYIVSNGVRYDLENPESIKNIIIPRFKDIDGMPNTALDMSYIIKMKANKENRPELAVPLCYKAANLMLATPIAWQRKDYYMVIKHLWLIGEIEFADYLETELKKRKVLDKMALSHIQMHGLNSDIVESNEIGCVCSECAKYTKRWFSISGQNKKYPKLPEYFKQNLEEHKYCNITFYPVLDGISQPIWNYSGDFIKFCNRPFEDKRTSEQKAHFEEYKIEREKQDFVDNRYCSRDYWIDKYQSQLEYQNIVDLLGEKAPKSYSGYMRMKNQNTKNYQKLMEIYKNQI